MSQTERLNFLDACLNGIIFSACLGWMFYDETDELIPVDGNPMDWDSDIGECDLEDHFWEEVYDE
jgi:hypothetical protein